MRDLCRFLFDPAPDGRIGVSVFYAWIDARGYRDAWDYTVRFKQKLRQDALDKVELAVPEIDWEQWEEEWETEWFEQTPPGNWEVTEIRHVLTRFSKK